MNDNWFSKWDFTDYGVLHVMSSWECSTDKYCVNSTEYYRNKNVLEWHRRTWEKRELYHSIFFLFFRYILLWIVPLVQDQSLDMLTSIPARYHCATDAPTPLTRQFSTLSVRNDKFFLSSTAFCGAGDDGVVALAAALSPVIESSISAVITLNWSVSRWLSWYISPSRTNKQIAYH